MAKELGLEELPADLLLRILFFADIYTVLTISQVNVFFHAIASTKQLWLLLTRDLFLRGLIDIPSDEVNLSLSSDELIAQIKRATDELHIIPGYLLLVNPQSEPLSVRIYSIPSPQRLWRRLSDFSPENVTPEPVIASTISVERGVGPRNNGGSNQVEVFVTTSLLHQNAYLLRVLDTVVYPDKSIRIASTHRLDLFEQTPQCTLLSISTQSTDGSMIRIVSRAGYNILPPLREGVRVVRLDDGEATFINYDGAERPFQVALPHNGGLVMVHRTHAELLYYY
ncbi:hypothetical protein C8R45DRAFT_1111943 [Mycena sanguinolenta]|nr:hypothetical protein C8R45DRAFT_1111943 [Mycena sanguinolenta]